MSTADLLRVALRQRAVFVPAAAMVADAAHSLNEPTALLAANLAKLGFGVSQALLQALNRCDANFHIELLSTLREVMGVDKNWTPLVKGWDTPTGESYIDHYFTYLANVFDKLTGERLACGHLIPFGTFPLERYTGCPFCGTPFQVNTLDLKGQGSNLRVLELWGEAEVDRFFRNLLQSKTALDATQLDSLNMLLRHFSLPEGLKIEMKETLIAVVDACLAANAGEKVQRLFLSPADILRYLWFKKTGFYQIVQPAVIVKRASRNSKHLRKSLDASTAAATSKKDELKLKYSRSTCRAVASWLNALPMSAEKACEIMHPKRSIWVRFIRALRLADYAKRKGFEPLARLMDVFYREAYTVWQAGVERLREKLDPQALGLLCERPGSFARALFANMLHFGGETTKNAFATVIDKVPARLLFTLNAYAEKYFDSHQLRSVKPLAGNTKSIPANPKLSRYSKEQLQQMQTHTEDLCLLAMQRRFAAQKNEAKSIYIDPALYKIPVSIGERGENVQDLPAALMGTRFPLQGDTVRLFMQWGEGLPAQHMDMDLSCRLAKADGTIATCYYANLTAVGSKHSGDIRAIPEKVGTAEYIDVHVPTLAQNDVLYATFTCNAYSAGSITPNMVIGWMGSENAMEISTTTGVAYDPSCVQQQIRITRPLLKGLLFGVLDVKAREIVWLELPFEGQLTHNLDIRTVEAVLAKLNARLNIGALLKLKAEAQGLQILDTAESAEEVYTAQWAMDTAAVTQLLID